jgi:hypothetical protein
VGGAMQGACDGVAGVDPTECSATRCGRAPGARDGRPGEVWIGRPPGRTSRPAGFGDPRSALSGMGCALSGRTTAAVAPTRNRENDMRIGIGLGTLILIIILLVILF